MGKKNKQKVRWTAVEENFFAGNKSPGEDDSGSDNPESTNQPNPKLIKQHHQNNFQQHYNNKFQENFRKGGPRRYGNWSAAPLAPRFERKAAAAAAAAALEANQRSGNGTTVNTIYYDGEPCEAEHLPDGFTKIRSKNLDVLFKRDYYAHKIDFPNRSNCSSERGDIELTSEAEEEDFEDIEEIVEEAEGTEKDSDESGDGENSPEAKKKRTRQAKKSESSNVDAAEKETNGTTSPYPVNNFNYSPNAPPFVPSSQQQNRPNLYLYAPSSNTIIPCEEIIIPNPVVGPDGGAVFPGPSNIYFAFPVDANGTPVSPQQPPSPTPSGYLPPPFIPPTQQMMAPVAYDQYGVPYPPVPAVQQQTYAPHITAASPGGSINTVSDASSATMYRSTSSEGGVTEPSSADSTTPHSPPDLSMYSPATWTNSGMDQGRAIISPNGYHVNAVPSWYHQHSHNELITATIPEDMEMGADGQQYMAPIEATTDAPITEDLSNQTKDEETSNSISIPGLHPELQNGANNGQGGKRVAKKRRKKKNNSNGVGDISHRGSSSSEDQFQSSKGEFIVKRILSRSDSAIVEETNDESSNSDSNKKESSVEKIPITNTIIEAEEASKETDEKDSACSSMTSSFISHGSETCDSKMESMSDELNVKCHSKDIVEEKPNKAVKNHDKKEDQKETTPVAKLLSKSCDQIKPDVIKGADKKQTIGCINEIPSNDITAQERSKADEKYSTALKTTVASVPEDKSNKKKFAKNKRQQKRSNNPPVDNTNNNKKPIENKNEKSSNSTVAPPTESKMLFSAVVTKNEKSLQKEIPKPQSLSQTSEVTKNKKSNPVSGKANKKSKHHQQQQKLDDNDGWEIPNFPEEGEWETKTTKKGSKRSRQRQQNNHLVNQETEILHISTQDLPDVPEKLSPVTQKEETVAPQPKPEVNDVKVEEDKTETKKCDESSKEESPQPTTKRSNNKRKKKRYASQEQNTESKSTTRPVLIQDGLIDFSGSSTTILRKQLSNDEGKSQSRRRNESQILLDAEEARKIWMDKLFISSIGHGIQQGPLMSGRIGIGKYTPPDRTNEIPLKFRTQVSEEKNSINNENDEVEITTPIIEEIPNDIQTVKKTTTADLDLD